MNDTDRLAAHLEVARAEWPLDLAGSGALSGLQRVARGFPREVAGLFAECHLSHPERTDLVARVVASDRVALRDGGTCPESFVAFVRLWCDPVHAAYHLPAIDIEWDMDGGAPFLCPYFEPDLIRGHRAIAARRRQRTAQGQECLALEHGPAVLRALDPSIPDTWFERLAESVRALPEYGVLIPGWSQLTRPGGAARPALRVIIALPRQALASYLQRLRWVGNVSEALTSMNLLRPSSPWIGFDADVCDGGLGPRLGFYQEHQCVCGNDPDIVDVLDRLEQTGWCDPKRLRGMRAWFAQQPAQPALGDGRSLSLKLVVGAPCPQPEGSQPAGAHPGRPVVKAYISTFDVPVAMRRSESVVLDAGR
jgi:hypothetical protein